MVNSINTSIPDWSKFTPKSKQESSKKDNTSITSQSYLLEKKTKDDSKFTNKFQVIAVGISALASAVFIVYMLKGLSLFGKNKQLLNEINSKKLPEKVKSKLLLEYDKYKKSIMDVDGTQNYIKNVLRLKWETPQQHSIDINKAKEILDADHVGLTDVKKEIIKFLTLQNYNLKNNIQLKEPLILCLDGPPGTGKTSIAESVAKAMDRPFERISLASVNNKSFIKGAERVFKSAEPGQIIKSLQNAGVSNPVILLDEIDKMGRSVEHGDPAFALLDALEPKQCKNFTDENIELPYDLSNVTFIITSNELKNIPEVLKNRLEIIHIPAYGNQEKTNICNFAIKRMMADYKLNSAQVEFTDDGVQEIVEKSNDKGARKTIENIKSIFKDVIQEIELEKPKEKIILNKKKIEEILKNKQSIESTEENLDLANALSQVIQTLNSYKKE